MSSTLTPARAIRQPRRFDLRILLGLILALVAAGGGIISWDSATDTRGVLVAVRDLPAGATLSTSDLNVARVRLTDELYAVALPASEQPTLVGQQLAEPIHAGQVLVRVQVAGQPLLHPDQLALTIAARTETAAGGRLRPGDAVRVFLTRDKGKPDSSTSVVLERVTVYAVGYDERLTAISPAEGTASRADNGPLASLTLVVTSEQAAQLANAKWNGELDVALLPPVPAQPAPAPAGSR